MGFGMGLDGKRSRDHREGREALVIVFAENKAVP
jgi:hypothetical protein